MVKIHKSWVGYYTVVKYALKQREQLGCSIDCSVKQVLLSWVICRRSGTPVMKCIVALLKEFKILRPCRVTLNNWCTYPQCLKDKLDWPPLQKRRTYQKICLCRCINSLWPVYHSFHKFTPHFRPTKSHKNSLSTLSRPFDRTCHHSSSYVTGWSLYLAFVSWSHMPLAKISLK